MARAGGRLWGLCQHSIPAESNATYSTPLCFTRLLVNPPQPGVKVGVPNRMPEISAVKSHLQYPLAMRLWTGTSLYPSVFTSMML